MQRLSLKIFIFILLLAGAFGLALPQAYAKTSLIQGNDCAYRLKVSLVFDFQQVPEKEASWALPRWQKAAQETWSKQNAGKNFSADCRLDYDFDFKALGAGQTCADYPEDHCLTIVNSKTNSRGHIADTVWVKPNSSKNSRGEWSIFASDLVIAHEVGHLMGLKDEYHYQKSAGNNKWVNDNPKQFGPQSIMAQTWGNVAVYPEHVQETFRQAGLETVLAKFDNKSAEYEMTVTLNKDLINTTAIYDKHGQKIYTDRVEPAKLKGHLIRNQSDNAVYLMTEQGKLAWLPSEQRAKELFGKNWQQSIIWFSDAILFTYQFTDQL